MNAFVWSTCYAFSTLGMPNMVASSSQSQVESYASASESSYSATSLSSSSSSSCSSINTSAYQDAFKLASICNTEAELYLQYLSKLSESQITAFNELIKLYSTKSFALADYVTDFAGFQSELSSIYQSLSAQSIYEVKCDWASQTSVYQQVQANLAKALKYTSQDSCLYNVLSLANTDISYLPLVAGCCHHLTALQNQYFSVSSSSSSASYSESSSLYQASSSSSSSAMSQITSAGNTVAVC